MIKSNFSLEKKLLERGYDWVIGVDEAGRGPLAGPVVAAAACFKKICHCEHSEAIPKLKSGIATVATCLAGRRALSRNDMLFNLIRDSKTLSEKQREEIFDFIHENFYVGVGICDHKTIDRINILEASFLAMKKAVADLMKNFKRSDLSRPKRPKEVGPLSFVIILVDGNKKIPNFSLEQKAIVNGDKIIKSISAASIIAKVTRDRIMRKMDKKYPEYQFARHKGYGTKLHMKMLEKHKPCKIHRRTFAPVRKLLKKS